MLTALGASPVENGVYRLLVTVVSASEEEIADATGRSREDVVSALASLADRGLVERMAESPTRFVAASPSVIQSMISERVAELRAAQQRLEEVAPQFEANSLARTANGIFEIIRGRDALRRRSVSLIRSAQADVIVLAKPPFIAFQAGESVDLCNSVRNRVIYETPLLSHPAVIDLLGTDVLACADVRAHSKLPIKGLAIDRSAALLPLAQHDTTPVGVLVHESAVLEAMLVLFEYVWTTAVPLRIHRVTEPTPQTWSVLTAEQRELLSLLLAGLSDEAVAMHRGLSVRTVQRKVHALMEVANVRTRMQLAWEAALMGWLADADVEPEDDPAIAPR